MITGKLDGISRAKQSLQLKKMLEDSSVMLVKLNYLIIGKNPTSKTVNKAKDLNIQVIDQNKWNELLNKIE